MNMNNITIKGKSLTLPTFFPDATRGVIRSVDSNDLRSVNVPGIVVNTYHLMTHPGASVIKSHGGIKTMMDWDGFVISDSGGFQLMSLIQQQTGFGKVSDDGITFYRGSTQEKKKYQLTPEKAIQVQFALDADIMICLDAFTPVGATREETQQSVRRTVTWARRCKDEFDRQVKQRKFTPENRPLLFGVIQGGEDPQLRTECAIALKDIGFDGYGFGGWPIDDTGELSTKTLKLTADLMEDDKPKYALGVGNPSAIVACARMGYTIFDCVLPTRDARHKRLYVFTEDPKSSNLDGKFWSYIHIHQEKNLRDKRPLSEWCDCLTCTHYSRAYLNHLFAIRDTLAYRLATIHNLRFYTQLIERIRSH